MNMQLIQTVQKKFKKKVPVFKAGSTVRVHQRIKEGGKERVQIFEGLVIAVNSGTGPDKTFTVRKMVGSIGVEKIFPLYSKNITKIQVTKSSDVRRSKLYYMRKRSGKSARLKEKHLTEKDVLMEEHQEEVVEPEVTTDDTAPAPEAESQEPEAPAKEEEPKKDTAPAEDTPAEEAEKPEKKEEPPAVKEDKAEEPKKEEEKSE